MRDLFKSSVFWFAFSAFLVLVSGSLFAWGRWDWLRDGGSETASNGETLRNAGLLTGGALAFVFAGWRAWVSERQTATAQVEAATAQLQAEIAEKGLLNERYERGAEMLGNPTLAVRLGGIFALRRLAEEHPEQYHIQIMELLCAFVRHPTKDTTVERPLGLHHEFDNYMRTLRADVQEAMQAIGSRSPSGISLERSRGSKLYLRDSHLVYLQVQDANLSCAWLTNAKLTDAELPRANLSNARLRQAILYGAKLRGANLSDAKLWDADLTRAILQNAILSGTDFCGIDANSQEYGAPARGLIQAQLDVARADPDNPPKLDGVLDAETGAPLVWRGKPLDGEG